MTRALQRLFFVTVLLSGCALNLTTVKSASPPTTAARGVPSSTPTLSASHSATPAPTNTASPASASTPPTLPATTAPMTPTPTLANGECTIPVAAVWVSPIPSPSIAPTPTPPGLNGTYWLFFGPGEPLPVGDTPDDLKFGSVITFQLQTDTSGIITGTGTGAGQTNVALQGTYKAGALKLTLSKAIFGEASGATELDGTLNADGNGAGTTVAAAADTWALTYNNAASPPPEPTPSPSMCAIYPPPSVAFTNGAYLLTFDPPIVVPGDGGLGVNGAISFPVEPRMQLTLHNGWLSGSAQWGGGDGAIGAAVTGTLSGNAIELQFEESLQGGPEGLHLKGQLAADGTADGVGPGEHFHLAPSAAPSSPTE